MVARIFRRSSATLTPPRKWTAQLRGTWRVGFAERHSVPERSVVGQLGGISPLEYVKTSQFCGFYRGLLVLGGVPKDSGMQAAVM